jgi:hypothetical protein
MTMQVRSLRVPTSHRRRHVTRARRVDSGTPAVAPQPRRGAEPIEDHALYTCHCGFVFEAPVSTSVGCPHCSATQAW